MTDSSDAVANFATAAHDILGMLIPIVAIVMGIGIGMLAIWLDYRKKREIYQLHHAERMAAIEKGVEVPPLPPELFQTSRQANATPAKRLYRGLLFTLLGAAFFIAHYMSDAEYGYWPHKGQTLTGLLLLAVGVANLLSYAIESRRNAASNPIAPIVKDNQR